MNAEEQERLQRVERIAMRALLQMWVEKFAPSCKPGAWEYDHKSAELCEESASLLGIGDPWQHC
jgi:hypothetical protein